MSSSTERRGHTSIITPDLEALVEAAFKAAYLEALVFEAALKAVHLKLFRVAAFEALLVTLATTTTAAGSEYIVTRGGNSCC